MPSATTRSTRRRRSDCVRASGRRTINQAKNLPRFAHAAQLVLAERLEPAAVAHRGGKLRRHQQIAAKRLAQRLDAGDLVDRGSDHREIETVDCADVAVKHLARMERE